MFSGCLGSPVPLPRRNRGLSGEEHKLDLRFLNPGVTTRSEVDQTLGWLAVNYQNPHLFWGRWSSSAVGYWVVVGGYYQAAAGGGRIWGVHNVVLSFDDHGLLRETHLADEDAVLRALHQALAQTGSAQLDLSQPVVLDVEHWHGGAGDFAHATLELTADSLDLQEFSRRLHYAHLTPPDIRGVMHSGLRSHLQNSENPSDTTLTLVLRKNTRMGEKITLRMSTETLLTVLQYLQQTGSADLAWE